MINLWLKCLENNVFVENSHWVLNNVQQINKKHHYIIDFSERKITTGCTPKIDIIFFSKVRHFLMIFWQNIKVFVLKKWKFPELLNNAWPYFLI